MGARAPKACASRLRNDARGVSSVEFVLILILVAVVGFGAWRALGATTQQKIRCATASLFGPSVACAEAAPQNDLPTAPRSGAPGSGQGPAGSGSRAQPHVYSGGQQSDPNNFHPAATPTPSPLAILKKSLVGLGKGVGKALVYPFQHPIKFLAGLAVGAAIGAGAAALATAGAGAAALATAGLVALGIGFGALAISHWWHEGKDAWDRGDYEGVAEAIGDATGNLELMVGMPKVVSAVKGLADFGPEFDAALKGAAKDFANTQRTPRVSPESPPPADLPPVLPSAAEVMAAANQRMAEQLGTFRKSMDAASQYAREHGGVSDAPPILKQLSGDPMIAKQAEQLFGKGVDAGRFEGLNGYTVISRHGGKSGQNAAELILQAAPELRTEKGPILLMTCYGAESGTAAALARLTGRPVVAATGQIQALRTGVPVITDFSKLPTRMSVPGARVNINPAGEWRTFLPPEGPPPIAHEWSFHPTGQWAPPRPLSVPSNWVYDYGIRMWKAPTNVPAPLVPPAHGFNGPVPPRGARPPAPPPPRPLGQEGFNISQ